MSTIGGLYLPKFETLDYGRAVNQGILGASQQVQGQTELVRLADLKRQQDEAAAAHQFMQQHPEFVFGGGGPPQSLIGSLQTAPGGPPGGGPMTQQPFGPGGVGPTQTVPAYPDASRFAGVSPQGGGPIPPNVMGQVMPQVTPPQSTIGSLGEQPQPQAQPNPQQRLLALARTNPGAALKVQALMQGQQDQQWKLEERRLDMGVKVAEGVARELNSVTDQASLDAARERIRQYHPQAAAQIPQFYSKEALEPLIMKGVAVADLAKWRKDMATAQQTQMMSERLPKVFGAMEQFATGGGGQAPAAGAATAPGPAAPSAGRDGAAGDWTFQRTEARINEEEAKYPNIPKGLAKAVAYQESEYNPIASGDGGQAKSFFQLHEGAAKDAGIDPARRDDPELNIQGGVKYLSQKITQAGGDIEKALSLYNRGTPDYRGKGDPNYIQNVYKHWQKSSTAGGTSTSQAPATNPRVAQLDADIKRGNALALQVSMIPGMETAAATLRAQVENLSQERARLDAPRQDFLKKQAVQGLELEQKQQEGVARAQLEADTKPASKEEIDAVNRSLPPDKRVPYGTTQKQLREQGRVGGELLAPKILEDLTTTTTAIQQFEELSNAVTALPTGPLTQYVEGFKERWGIDISDEKVAQRAILQGATNQLLQARSGAAISEGEYQRLLKELPNEGLDHKVFKARLANTVRQFKNMYKTKVQILRKVGHAIPDDLMEPLAAPEGPPAPKVSSNVDKFKALKP